MTQLRWSWIAAKLAGGYRLDELKNDVTREASASFKPGIVQVVADARASPLRSCRRQAPR